MILHKNSLSMVSHQDLVPEKVPRIKWVTDECMSVKWMHGWVGKWVRKYLFIMSRRSGRAVVSFL